MLGTDLRIEEGGVPGDCRNLGAAKRHNTGIGFRNLQPGTNTAFRGQLVTHSMNVTLQLRPGELGNESMGKIGGKHRGSIHIRLLNQMLQLPQRQLCLDRKRQACNKPVNGG